jgi:sugar fermentation stimulation protein A
MGSAKIFLRFPKPQRGAIFLNRPQRFLARMIFEDGEEETVYCANPGAMTGLLTEGQSALVWDSENRQRSRRYTWRAVEFQGNWVGTDTHLSNRIVEEIIKAKLLPEFETVTEILREQLIEEGVRVDFSLSGNQGECLVEVKSASIVLDGIARYPDSKTPRGIKQLQALTRRLKGGQRVVLLFLVQRNDVHSFMVTDEFDPAYSKAFLDAVAAGLEVMPIAVKVSREGFSCPRLLPYSAVCYTENNCLANY